MNYKVIGRVISLILIIEAAFMIPALILCFIDGNINTATAFMITIGIALLVSLPTYFVCRGTSRGFYAKEGFVCVGLSWIVMSILGCLPFVISGEIPHFIDALFETVSGFTTTGASILSDVEALSRGALYWRSFTHWLGGMGVLVFLLAISSIDKSKGGATLHLLRAESPGPNVGKLAPRMKRTATILYLIYIVLTIINFLFLIFGKMNWFEALCTAFGTAGTGGFGIKNDSMAGYSPYIQNVTTVFMLLFGINFTCYYWILIKQFKSILKNEELWFYFGTIVVAIILICINVSGSYQTFGETVRHAAFQVSSIITTTGYSTTDFNLWPSFSKMVILMLMIIGACAGSTGGGFKCSRVVLLFKIVKRHIKRMLHPQSVHKIRMDGQSVNEEIVTGTNVYLATYTFILIISLLIVSLDNFSIEAHVSAVFSCVNNIGPGLAEVGPLSNFGGYSLLSKIVLIVDMLAGRLELFPMLILFSRKTWTK